MQKVTRLLIASFFASIIFVTRFFVPPPLDKLLIVVDAVLLALSALFVRNIGATYVGAVGGALVGLLRPSLLPFSFLYFFLYGFLIDAFLFLFRINATAEGVNRNKLVIAMAVNTLLIGFLSYYTVTLFPTLIPHFPALDMMVAFMGPATGATAGYAASYLWNKYLRFIVI
ncbi:MAG TPA: hypothetical protein VJ507_04060 [Candidatus Bathyarchaeia archaeon]|nr:hypothetical protein [Candidatus Bathyarchaeia archaeon]